MPLTYPATNAAYVADRRPVSPKHGGFAMTSATSYTTPIPSKVIIAVTVAGTVTLTFLDGSTAQLTLPVGVFQLDAQVTMITTGTATATYAGLYDITGG